MINLKGWRTLGFNLLLILIPPALTYLASVHWQDYLSPTWAPVVIGGVGIVLRIVTDSPIFKKAAIILLAIGIGLGSLPGPAHAQTVVTKAPYSPISNVFSGYASGGCGLYAGINTLGSASGVNGGAPGTVVAQGNVGATVGYGCPIGNTAGNFWFAEGMFDWANLNGANAGLSMTGPAHFEQRLGIGSPISTLFNRFPGFNGLSVPDLPGLPNGITYGPSYPYFFASAHEQDISASIGVASAHEWLFSPGFGLGIQSRLSNGVVADVAAEWVLQSSGVNVGPQKVSFGNAAMVSFQLKY